MEITKEKLAKELRAHGEFGTTNSANIANSEKCAEEIIRWYEKMLVLSPAPVSAEMQQEAWGAAAVEKLAEWLCAEFDFSLNPCIGFSWPTHADDDGYRGDDAWVRLQPPDVQGHARDNARRIIRFLQGLEKPVISPPDLAAENARLREALEPFSKLAGVLFERNFNASDVVTGYESADGGVCTVLAGDFFKARAALSDQKGGA